METQAPERDRPAPGEEVPSSPAPSDTDPGADDLREEDLDGRFLAASRKRSEALLSATQRLTRVGGWEWDIATRTMTWTAQLYRMHGFAPSDLPPGSAEHIARSLACYGPGDRTRITEAFERCVALGEPYDIVCRFYPERGGPLWVRTAAEAVLDEGRVVRVLGNFVDITEYKAAEEALQERERELDAMICASPESAFLIDPEGLILTCNVVAAERLGTRPETILGRSLYTLIPPDLAAERRKAVERVVVTGEPFHFEDMRADRVMSHYLNPVKDGGGRVVRIAVFAHDITAFRDGEERLRAQNALLASIRHAQSLFISGESSRAVFAELLHILIQATQSAYGFLDEVLREPDGTPYKLSLALSDIAWDEASLRLHEALVSRKLEFRNLDNLAGAPVLEGRTVIANDVGAHPRFRGLPAGHPSLASYLGIPLRYGQEIIGVAGVANRPGGYSEAVADFVAPLTQACSAILWAERVARKEREHRLSLETSEKNYRRIAETANEGIWAMDGAYRTTFVNRHMAVMLGYEPEEMLGRTVDSFMLPEDLEDHGAQMALRRGGKDAIYERRFRHRDGSVVWTIVSATSLQDPEGGFAGSFAMFTDITERKRVEEALRSERDRMQRYLDTANTVIVALDPSGRITMINRFGADLLGRPEEDLLGRNWFETVLPRPEGRDKVLPVFQAVMRGDLSGAREFENEILTASGERRMIAWRNTYLRDEEGRPVGTLSSGMDITEKRATEERVRQLHKAESLGVMAGAIAHHFNNQLGVVLGNVEMALEETREGSAIRKYLKQAMSGVRRATEVSTQMLTYLGHTTGKPETLDLSEVCRRTLLLLQATLPPHILLHSALPSLGPFVFADPGEIRQILTHLVTNAREAMPGDRGEIHLKVSTVSGRDIPETHCFPVGWVPKEGPYACVEVRDTGCGIPEGDMERLFDPFFSTKFPGRGLGLPTSLGILKAHEGGLSVGNHTGERAGQGGAVFRVFLPCAPEPVLRETKKGKTPEGGPTDPAAPETGRPAAVLVVEDEPTLRRLTADMLQRLGMRTYTAGDGFEALRLLEGHQEEVSCVVCDLTMPRMDGWQTMKALRERAPGLPVILASGYDEATVLTGMHAHRPQAFLFKPFSLRDLREAVSRAIGSAKDQGKGRGDVNG